MRSHALTHAGLRLARWFDRRTIKQAGIWTMVAFGPLLAVATVAVLSEMQWFGGGDLLRPVLLADFVYALVVAVFVAQRIAGMIAERRRRSAGSKLHMRLVRIFTAIALIPTILVAVFAAITVNFGLEGWFSDRVRNVVANSLAAAEAYEEEHRVTLQTDAQVLGAYLNELGLSEEAIVYITSADPKSMRWLTTDDAAIFGIELKMLATRNAQPLPPAASSRKLEESFEQRTGDRPQVRFCTTTCVRGMGLAAVSVAT